jgi:hypothetical protein
MSAQSFCKLARIVSELLIARFISMNSDPVHTGPERCHRSGVLISLHANARATAERVLAHLIRLSKSRVPVRQATFEA